MSCPTSLFLVSSRPLPVSHPPHATYLQLVFFSVNHFLRYSKDDVPFALLVQFDIMRLKRKTYYSFPFLLPRHHAPVHLLKRYTCPLIKITLWIPLPFLLKTTSRSSHFSSYLQEILNYSVPFLNPRHPAPGHLLYRYNCLLIKNYKSIPFDSRFPL